MAAPPHALETDPPAMPQRAGGMLFALAFAGLAISVWPYVVPRAVTIWEAAPPQSSQIFLLSGTVVILPTILIYTGWAYWVFRGKVHGGYH